MMTFEEVWNYQPESKYVTVFITGPKLKIDPYELVVRLDSALNPYGIKGNDRDFNFLIEKWQNVPVLPDDIPYKNKLISRFASIPDIIKTYSCTQKEAKSFQKDIHKLSNDIWHIYDEAKDKFNCYWGQFTNGFHILHINLFSSIYGEPKCWFNVENGKVGGFNTLGKWPETLAEMKPELEWFRKEFPEVDITLSVKDNNKIVTQLHLHDGLIEVEEPNIPLKKLEKLFNTSYNKYSDNKKYFSFWYKFYRRHIQTKKAKLAERSNVWKMSRMYNEQYFSWENALNIIDWWENELREYWKEHSFEEEWQAYKNNYLENI